LKKRRRSKPRRNSHFAWHEREGKNTLETSGKDIKLHSKRVENSYRSKDQRLLDRRGREDALLLAEVQQKIQSSKNCENKKKYVVKDQKFFENVEKSKNLYVASPSETEKREKKRLEK
jgi:hypothetical protein